MRPYVKLLAVLSIATSRLSSNSVHFFSRRGKTRIMGIAIADMDIYIHRHNLTYIRHTADALSHRNANSSITGFLYGHRVRTVTSQTQKSTSLRSRGTRATVEVATSARAQAVRNECHLNS